MSEEFTQKNTVATVGMRFSIIWLIALITLFFAWLWLPMLFVWFILWIIGLFYKPRGKARVAVCIPLIVFIALTALSCYIWSSVKTPAKEFLDWVKPQFEQLESNENFDGDRFGNILESELNNITKDKSEDDWKVIFEDSTGSNLLEKGSYLFFSLMQQWFENALEKYNNGELPEISDEDNDIIDVDIVVENNDEKNNDEENNDEENTEEESTEEEITVEQPKKTNNETFSQSEKNDIEQILNILE